MICEANGQFTPTNGYVCSEHFSSEENFIIGKKGETKLNPNCIPTEFWVDCIEYEDNSLESDPEENFNNTNTENTESNSAMLKQKLDLEIQQCKLTGEIERLKIVNEKQSNEIAGLKSALNTEEKKTNKLEKELSEAKASPDYIQVGRLISPVFFMFSFACKQNFPG